jgi:hypothetical protein
MSQHDLDIANQGFPATRADLNLALKALGSLQSGATAPSTTYANMLWYDTANNILKIRNEDNDAFISIFTLDQTADNIEALTINGTMTADVLAVNSAASITANLPTFTITGQGRANGFEIAGTTGNTTLTEKSNNGIEVGTNNTTRMTITSGGNVGIGTGSPSQKLSIVESGGSARIELLSGTSGTSIIDMGDTSDADIGGIRYNNSNDSLSFRAGNDERLRIDNGGNVLVNQFSTSSPGFSNTTTGLCFSDSGRVFSSASGAASSFNRNTSDGGVIHIRKAGTLVGVLSVTDSDNFSLDCQTSSHSGITFGTANVIPRVNGANNDGNVDLGLGDKRWQNIYATNGTIQTSDETEKQNIASLTSAEITAAKAISKLFKTFKWKHRVSEEGDAARTHTGVIAQEVQTAMTDAGLNAADYAFWCSDTWWETSTEVAAVEAVDAVYEDVVIPAVEQELDADGNIIVEAQAERAEQRLVTEAVEAKDAYTRIDTYYTADEAPEGATERTRMGIRYPELLAFVGAATEQRLTDIETRLSALENA